MRGPSDGSVLATHGKGVEPCGRVRTSIISCVNIKGGDVVREGGVV